MMYVMLERGTNAAMLKRSTEDYSNGAGMQRRNSSFDYATLSMRVVFNVALNETSIIISSALCKILSIGKMTSASVKNLCNLR